MRSREFDRIEDKYSQVVSKVTATCPVKIGQLAKDLGIAVKVASMRVGISGQITKETGKYIIRVNRHEARERQRFTIAHELGHFFLHRSLIDSSPEGIVDSVLYRSGAPERIEFEANRLGADLIMPHELVKKKLKEEFNEIVTEATIARLAAVFEVSKAAMEIRLAAISERK
jgi:Zn-dependent peptidase ImmA (M78 family)